MAFFAKKDNSGAHMNQKETQKETVDKLNIGEAFEKCLHKPPTETERKDPYWIAWLRRKEKAVELTLKERQKSEVLAYFPLIRKKEEAYTQFWGGAQSWYPRVTQRQAGCSAVAAANILATAAAQHKEIAEKLSLHFLQDGRIDQNEFIKLMEQCYRRIGTFEVPVWNKVADRNEKDKTFVPASFGQQAAGFVLGTLKLAKQKGIYLSYDALPAAYLGYKQGLQFIRENLGAGHPVALLTTWNRHPLEIHWTGYSRAATPLKKGMKSHFVTVVGIRSTGLHGAPELLVSSWGKIGSVPYDKLYKSWQSPLAMGAGLFSFSIAGKSESEKAIIKAYTLLPQMMAKTVTGTLLLPFNKSSRQR